MNATESTFTPVEVSEALETPVLPEIMTTVNSPALVKSNTYIDNLRASFIAKPSKYIFNGSEKTFEEWSELYPPQVAEYSALPGSGLPHWHAEFSYCTSCNNTLNLCNHNPYAVMGAITIARNEVQERHRQARLAEATALSVETQIVDAITGEITIVPAKVRKERGILKQRVSEELELIIEEAYLKGTSVVELSNKHSIAVNVLYDYLKKKNILRKKGESTPNGKPRGRAKTTLDLTSELIAEAKSLIEAGNSGGVVVVAKAMNVNPNLLSVALKAEGVKVTRGGGKALAEYRASKPVKEKAVKIAKDPNAPKKPKGKKRTTLLITDKLLAKAIKMAKAGKGMVVIAKELNLAPAELSPLLKKVNGIEIRKGKRKSTVV